MINKEKIMDVIELADKAFPKEKVNREIDNKNLYDQVLKGYPKELQELFDCLISLTEQEQCELVALVWVAREDYSYPADWNIALQKASKDVDNAAGYLSGMFPLADYLRKALKIIN